MLDVRLKTRIQNKYKTLDEWNSLVKGEFIPLKGEICYATVNNDTVYQKIGDGITDFTELEWLNSVGVDVVNTFNDLSKNAKKDDIAFVEEPAIVEKVENEPTIMALNFVHPNVAEPIVLNTNDQTRMLSELDWGENYPHLTGEDKTYYIEIMLQGNNDDAYTLEATLYSAEDAKIDYNVNHPVEFYNIYTNKDFELIKLKGMTIKKYIYNRFGKYYFTEDQMEILFGEHYNDVLSPNVSYNWIKLSTTSEPLNETSVLKGHEYYTLEYDVDVNLSTKAYVVDVRYFVAEGLSDENYLLNSFYEDFSTLSSNELIEACNYINFFLSGIFNSGIKEISYDKYENIGFQYFKDNKWDSLESKMNLTKVVKQYKDLPKTFITNGIAAVSQYSKVATRPFSTIGLETYFNLYLDINVGYEDMIQSIYKLLGLSQDTSHDFSLEVAWTDIDDNDWGGFFAYKENNQSMFGFTEPSNPFRKYDDQDRPIWYAYKDYIYISQDNTYLDIGEAYDKNDSNDYSNYYFETAGWYSWLIWDDGKTSYIKEAPVKVENSKYLFDEKAIRITGIEVFSLAPEGEESLELSNFEFAAFKFKIPNSYQEYPQGFYKFNGKEWNYAPTINGPKFTNKQLLDQITEEDIGNIVLNTEARHTHNNKSILDSITKENLFSNQIAQAISDEILKCQKDITELQNEVLGANALADAVLETIGGES